MAEKRPEAVSLRGVEADGCPRVSSSVETLLPLALAFPLPVLLIWRCMQTSLATLSASELQTRPFPLLTGFSPPALPPYSWAASQGFQQLINYDDGIYLKHCFIYCFSSVNCFIFKKSW